LLSVFRLAYKPHSVQRLIPVYANPSPKLRIKASSRTARLCDHLSQQPTQDSSEASRFLSLLGLAPGGGYLAARIAANAGGLLHHLFTITSAQGKGGLFLWP